MLSGDPVKIPDITGKINFLLQDGMVYVRYLAGRKYNPEKKYNVPEWVKIGRQIEAMPTLMYPNDNYEKYFCEEESGMDENMTCEEEQYVLDHGVYGTYNSFFTGLYNEFKQLTRRKADDPVNQYKAENINKVLEPLKELMHGEEYADLLGLIETGEDRDEGMTYGDVLILLTQYKSALAKYRRNRI